MPLFHSSRMQLLEDSSTVDPSATSNRRLTKNFRLELSSPTWNPHSDTVHTSYNLATNDASRRFPEKKNLETGQRCPSLRVTFTLASKRNKASVFGDLKQTVFSMLKMHVCLRRAFQQNELVTPTRKSE